MRRIVLHRLHLDLAPLREVGQRRRGNPSAATAAGDDAPRLRLHVVHRDAAAGARSVDRRDVDAELARVTARRGRGSHLRGRARCRSRLRRRSGRRPRRRAVDVDDLGRCCAAGAGAEPRVRWRAEGAGCAQPAVCRGCRRRRRAARLRRRGLVHRQHDLADLHLLARLDPDLLDDARDARRHFDGRLVGLELENGLIVLQLIARLHHDANHVAGGDVLAKFGKYEVSHGCPRP